MICNLHFVTFVWEWGFRPSTRLLYSCLIFSLYFLSRLYEMYVVVAKVARFTIHTLLLDLCVMFSLPVLTFMRDLCRGRKSSWYFIPNPVLRFIFHFYSWNCHVYVKSMSWKQKLKGLDRFRVPTPLSDSCVRFSLCTLSRLYVMYVVVAKVAGISTPTPPLGHVVFILLRLCEIYVVVAEVAGFRVPTPHSESCV